MKIIESTYLTSHYTIVLRGDKTAKHVIRWQDRGAKYFSLGKLENEHYFNREDKRDSDELGSLLATMPSSIISKISHLSSHLF